MKISEAPRGPLGNYGPFDQVFVEKSRTGVYTVIGMVESDIEPLFGPHRSGSSKFYEKFQSLHQFLESQYGAKLRVRGDALSLFFDTGASPDESLESAVQRLQAESLVEDLYRDASLASVDRGYSQLARDFTDWDKIWGSRL